jgi:hypothetical protein
MIAMTQRRAHWFLWIGMAMLAALTACGPRATPVSVIPTVASVEGLATAQVMTQNAPPTAWQNTISFPQVDKGLTSLSGWRYEVTLSFTGKFTGTTRDTTASAQAQVYFNQLGSARRVIVSTSGELLGRTEDTAYEAVRLGPDAFLVQNNTCLSNAEQDAQTAADLKAGDLVGGVNRALPYGMRATMNGEDAYRYSFGAGDLNLPTITLGDGGTMDVDGELWVAPDKGVVVRYYATLDVTNARIFGRTLPVDGQAIMRYDLYDIGKAFNITQPFGC